MILQALNEYYGRKSRLPESPMTKDGFDWKEIPYICHISKEGRFAGFEDTREGEAKKKRGKAFLVPTLGEAKGNGIKANLLWENVEYVFGVTTKESSNPARVQEQAKAFREKIAQLAPDGLAEPWRTVGSFLSTIDREALERDPLWPEVRQATSLVLIAVDGYGSLQEYPEVADYVMRGDSEGAMMGWSLISGENTQIARLVPQVRGVKDASSMGASLVAVNIPAGESYHKEQAYVSPIGSVEAEHLGKAINWLLRGDSQNKLYLGDATIVFWAGKEGSSFEKKLPSFFLSSRKSADDPDKGASDAKSNLLSVITGTPPEELSMSFYILGLSPSSARISVRFWHAGKIGDFCANMRKHFDDLDIVAPSFDECRMSLRFFFESIVFGRKSENIPPNLAGNVVRAVLEGLPYPSTLENQCLRRIRAEHDVTRVRASILKACLNRRLRVSNPLNEKEITVALDQENSNVGYRLGRLFAVLEKIQEDANPGISATIRDRFYGAASSNPVAVFPQLLKLKNHHLAKFENQAFRIAHEKRLAEIIDGLPTAMPAHLDMSDQSRFAIGYYHQRQALFTSNKEPK